MALLRPGKENIRQFRVIGARNGCLARYPWPGVARVKLTRNARPPSDAALGMSGWSRSATATTRSCDFRERRFTGVLLQIAQFRYSDEDVIWRISAFRLQSHPGQMYDEAEFEQT